MSFLLLKRLFPVAVLWFGVAIASASGPRWVTGEPYFYPAGRMMVWYTDNPLYFTDPGDLSAYVNHAQADTIVAAAASVWTIPTSRLNLTYGGLLDEDVSSSNVYASASGIVFPADVQSSNYVNKQIAVLYDSDGSITDLLLGSGASNPSSCRQNAVTESVDSFAHWGSIQHAILVLNGRCTGPAPEQQLQLQYQLMRSFGRIIGLGWSQTNDNVFTGNPRPTYQQALHWPVMHPIDVICGPYTYQCMPQPFTLRDDDISGLGLLYPVSFFDPVAPGKTDTRARGSRMKGTVTFPNGQGMQGVNVVIHRLEPFWDTPEDWESTSAVTGYLVRRSGSNSVSGNPPALPFANQGNTDLSREGYYEIARTPLYDWEGWQNYVIYTQAINPLYIGAYAVGPYDSSAVAPSGSVTQQRAWVVGPYADFYLDFTIPDAQTACDSSAGGTPAAPVPISSSGWWTGNLCFYGNSAWSSATVQPNRTYTLEVTAQDEHSVATTSKMLPVVGLWNASDATGLLPTVAAAPAAFNSTVTGMTMLSAQATQPQQLRIAITDERGDGRPDYNYQARFLYADSVSPATVPAFGGPIIISGMGFRPGNTVTINGVAATVTNWTANSITAVAPSLHASTAVTANVTIRDLTTHGTTTMTGALNYAAPQPTLVLVSAPSGQLFINAAAAPAFAVKALQADGITPIANTAVTFSTAGSARFDLCGASTCTLSTDSSGLISTTITPLAPGTIILTASSGIGTVTASFTAITRVQTVDALNPALYLAAGATVSWTLQVLLTDNSSPTLNLPVQWMPITGPTIFDPATSLTNSQSTAQTTSTAGPLAGNQQAVARACAWTTICTTFTVTGVDPAQFQLDLLSGAGQSLNASETFAPVSLRVVDSAGHPVAGAAVAVHQSVEPWTLWTLPCPDQGRCPIAPVYNSSTTMLTSALDGTINITPLALPGKPEITRIAIACGTQGFLSLSLQKQP
jgi:hypothetical protein